jgi:hypothetical protein
VEDEGLDGESVPRQGLAPVFVAALPLRVAAGMEATDQHSRQNGGQEAGDQKGPFFAT